MKIMKAGLFPSIFEERFRHAESFRNGIFDLLRKLLEKRQANEEFQRGPTRMSQEDSKWLVNGLFHLLINGIYWGYNLLILTFY